MPPLHPDVAWSKKSRSRIVKRTPKEPKFHEPLKTRMGIKEYRRLHKMLIEANRIKSMESKPRAQDGDSDFGFATVELEAGGALHLPSVSHPWPSLKVEPHGLFAIDKFTHKDIPWFICYHEALKPAWQLATLFLTHPSCGSFWPTLMYGKEEHCRAEQCQDRGERHFHIKKKVPYTEKRHEEWLKKLQDLVEEGSFHIGFQVTQRERFYHFWGLAIFEDNTVWIQQEFLNAVARIDIQLLAASDEEMESLLAMKLRLHFQLAVTVTHELVHLVGRHFREHEPHIFQGGQDLWSELGEAWEIWTFGGRIEPISRYADCRCGQSLHRRGNFSSWKPLDPNVVAQHPFDVFWAVPMSYVYDIQQQIIWDNSEDGEFLHIERFECLRRVGYNGLIKIEALQMLEREALEKKTFSAKVFRIDD